MNKKPTVVIIGGGYAGIRAALDILKSNLAHVILIDQSGYHALPTQWYELATLYRTEPKQETTGQEKQEFHEYLRSATISFGQIFHAKHDIEILRARVGRVVPNKSYVLLEDGKRIDYDWLVVAIGSKTNYFNIPHLEQNSIGLKSTNEALNIRDRLDELFASTPKHQKITVVVGGGGFTGCELAGELVGYMKRLSKQHARPMGNWACVVVEAGDSLFGASPAWVQKKAHHRLRELGVTVLLGSAIVDVWPNLLYLGEEKRTLSFDLLVWTAGVKGGCEAEILQGVAPGPKNCIAVTNELRLMGYNNVFVAGDVAATFDKDGKTLMGMTAQKAIAEGAYVGNALRVLLKNKHAKLTPYVPRHSSYIIPLGGKYALLQTPVVRISGIMPWILKYIVVFKYLVTIIPMRQAFQVTLREMKLYTRND